MQGECRRQAGCWQRSADLHTAIAAAQQPGRSSVWRGLCNDNIEPPQLNCWSATGFPDYITSSACSLLTSSPSPPRKKKLRKHQSYRKGNSALFFDLLIHELTALSGMKLFPPARILLYLAILQLGKINLT